MLRFTFSSLRSSPIHSLTSISSKQLLARNGSRSPVYVKTALWLWNSVGQTTKVQGGSSSPEAPSQDRVLDFRVRIARIGTRGPMGRKRQESLVVQYSMRQEGTTRLLMLDPLSAGSDDSHYKCLRIFDNDPWVGGHIE